MKKMITLLFSIAMITTSVVAQDTLFYYGWEPDTQPGPMGSIWNNTGQTWTHETIIDDEANARNGEGYFKAVVSASPPNEWDNQGVFQEITAEDNTSYRLTLWARVDGGDTTIINITSGRYETWTELNRKGGVELTGEWAKYTLMTYIDTAANLPLNNEQHQIRFPIHYYKEGTYFLDDVSIVKSMIAGAEVNGDKLTVDFGYALEWANPDDISADAFTVMVDGAEVDVTAAEMRDLGDIVEPWIDLTLASAVDKDANVTVSHDGNSGLYYAAYSPITDEYKAAVFTDEHVMNVTTETGIQRHQNEKVQLTLQNNRLKVVAESDIENISIYSISGQLFNIQKDINKKEVLINVSFLQKGMYVLILKTKNGNSGNAKFVIK